MPNTRSNATQRRSAALLGWIGIAVFGLLGCARAASPRLVVYPQPAPAPGAFLSPFAAEWFLRGELAMEVRDFRTAVEAFRTALSGSEEDVVAITRLAVALDAAGDSQGRDAALQRAEGLDPQSEALWLARGAIAGRAGALEEALDAYRKAADAAPPSDAPLLAAIELLREHDFPDRAAHALEGLDHGRAVARVKLALGLSRRDAGAITEALAVLRDRREIRAADACDAAGALLAAGDPFAARHALGIIDASDRCVALSITVLAATGTRTELEAALVRVHPQTLGDAMSAARLYLRAGHVEIAEALARTSGSDPEALLILGRALLLRGEYVGAAEAFAQIAEGTSRFAEAREGLRDALRAGGMGHLTGELAP